MPKQRLFVILVVTAIVAFVIGRSFSSQNATFTTPPAPSAGTSTTSSANNFAASIVSLTNDPANKLYQIEGEYPTFPSAPQINKETSDFVGTQLSQFETNAEQTWRAQQDTMPAGTPKQPYPMSPFRFILSWQPAQLNAHYISFVVRIGADEGGANTTDLVQTFNYDLTQKQDVTLEDLFPANQMCFRR